MTYSLRQPFPTFSDIDGDPLDYGQIYVGVAGLPAQANPTTVYWDAAMTIVAAQPVQTLGGFPMRAGAPAVLYVPGDVSMAVLNRNNTPVYQALNVTAREYMGFLSGTLPLAQGGTGATTQAGALAALGVLCSAVVAKTAAYTVVAADRGYVILANGSWTMGLTAAATLGAGFSFAVVNTSTGSITIDPNGAELIDGSATLTLGPNKTCIIVCDGTQFFSIGLSGSSSGGGGAAGGGTDGVFLETDQLATQDYTLGQDSMVSGLTVTIATPAVFTLAGHGFVAEQPVFFKTTGALPTGLSVDTGYYVISTGLTANSFQVSATVGGSAVATSGAQSGVHSVGKLKSALSSDFAIKTGVTVTLPTGSILTLP